MKLKSTNRRGFTLGEVLVSVAIVAVLAAIVIPAVGSQISKGDFGRVSNDLLSLRGAMEQFLTDVRRYPRSIGQLTTLPTASLLPIGTATQYTASEVNRWRGPYI